MKCAFKPLVLALAATLAGCATSDDMRQKAAVQVRSVADAVMAERDAPISVKTDDGIHISAIAVEYQAPPKGMVTLRVQDIPLSVALGGLAEGSGFSISYNVGVDSQRPLAIDVRDLEPQSAIREVAMAAGYIAVFDRPHSVTISKEASHIFRVPVRLLQTLTAQYTVTNSTGVGQATGGNNAQSNVGGSNSAGQPSSAQVRISGTSSTDGNGVKTFLATMSGAEIAILPDDGLISARGNASQLRRLNTFLDQYVRDGLTQVEVELSIVEVSLLNEFQSGIDWTRVIPANTTFAKALGEINLRAGLDAGVEALSVRSTSSSIDSIVHGLERMTTVNELTRPRLLAMNHAKKLYRSSVQRPFLPSATSNTSTGGSSNIVQSSAAVSYTEDGISFSVEPHVLDAHRIELKLIPVLTSTQSQVSFPVSKDITLVAPVQQRQDAHLEIVAEHGKTMVIGGLRTSAGRGQVAGVPGAVRVPGINLLVGGHDDRASAREVVMLLHTRIIPAPKINTLVGESI